MPRHDRPAITPAKLSEANKAWNDPIPGKRAIKQARKLECFVRATPRPIVVQVERARPNTFGRDALPIAIRSSRLRGRGKPPGDLAAELIEAGRRKREISPAEDLRDRLAQMIGTH